MTLTLTFDLQGRFISPVTTKRFDTWIMVFRSLGHYEGKKHISYKILCLKVSIRNEWKLYHSIFIIPKERTMVIWLYNDALGYARLLVQNEVSKRTMQKTGLGISSKKIGGHFLMLNNHGPWCCNKFFISWTHYVPFTWIFCWNAYFTS